MKYNLDAVFPDFESFSQTQKRVIFTGKKLILRIKELMKRFLIGLRLPMSEYNVISIPDKTLAVHFP